MSKFIQGALVANAASMGFNWIYNMPYLERLSQTESLVFQKPNPDQYKRAGKSYYVYPRAEIGDVSIQGEVLKWLYKGVLSDNNLSREAYKKLIYDHIKPGGSYDGYIESYGKKLVFNSIIDELKLDIEKQTFHDDQLVSFMPYLVCKELDLPLDKAWDLAQAFTDIDHYKTFFNIFDQLIANLSHMSMLESVENILRLVPQKYQESIELAIKMNDTTKFIIDHAGTDCHIHHALPLIFHILTHTNNYEDAVKLNVKLGGASCDRGLLIGAIYSQISEIPEDWKQKVNL
ncbi:MAG: ADP-ribosylglycohydrolase family protein [Acholeplasmataceae bacterium]|nr:ADP-ribosylglycohydrolase family protein [Acholeplasmataceae bacterium]